MLNNTSMLFIRPGALDAPFFALENIYHFLNILWTENRLESICKNKTC